jgi:hypothetical protein
MRERGWWASDGYAAAGSAWAAVVIAALTFGFVSGVRHLLWCGLCTAAPWSPVAVGMMAKLSGLAIDPSGKYAYVTVENEKKTVSISLKTDRVVSSQAGLISNRWYVTP